MTKEEAISKVRGYLTDYLPSDNYEEVVEIIKALEQGSTTKNDLGVDAVSRKEVFNQIFYSTDNSGDVVLGSALRERIEKLPSITPIRPKGHWIEEFNDLEGEVRFTCSSCGKYQLFGTDFCYNCGSDNRGVVKMRNDIKREDNETSNLQDVCG